MQRLMLEDLFAVGDHLPAATEGTLRNYFSCFAAPEKAGGKQVCPNCRNELNGYKQALGTGAVAHLWDIAHGEASCSGCGWPSRGHHYIKDADGSDLVTLRNFFLFYHRDYVERELS